MSFRDAMVGDRFTRMIAGTIPMLVEVAKVTDTVMYCWAVDKKTDKPLIWGEIEEQAYQFDLETGAEIDETIGWGPKFNITGSFLKRIN